MDDLGRSQEQARMLAENARRERELGADFYSLTRPANLFARHGQERALLWALGEARALPLAQRRILEVGCGEGQWLAIFESFGAKQRQLCGLDLDAARLEKAQERYARAELRLGDGAALPWPDGAFDLVWQSTVFTSVLDAATRVRIAGEMRRVLAPGGALLWYDFAFDNPQNPHVRGIGEAALRALFPGWDVRLRRVTLAPPIARRLVPLSWWLARGLEGLTLLNTHLIAVLRPPVAS